MRSAPVSSRTWSKPPARKNFHVWGVFIVLLVDPAINPTPAILRLARRHSTKSRYDCQLPILRRFAGAATAATPPSTPHYPPKAKPALVLLSPSVSPSEACRRWPRDTRRDRKS